VGFNFALHRDVGRERHFAARLLTGGVISDKF